MVIVPARPSPAFFPLAGTGRREETVEVLPVTSEIASSDLYVTTRSIADVRASLEYLSHL
jgi:hypothetical protein